MDNQFSVRADSLKVGARAANCLHGGGHRSHPSLDAISNVPIAKGAARDQQRRLLEGVGRSLTVGADEGLLLG